MGLTTEKYLERMAEIKRTPLAEAALKLEEAWQASHLDQKNDFGKDLCNEFYRVLTQVRGWKPYEARFEAQHLARAFQEVKS